MLSANEQVADFRGEDPKPAILQLNQLLQTTLTAAESVHVTLPDHLRTLKR